MSPMLDRAAIQRILLIRLSAVGDVINTLPAVSAVRASFPKAHLVFVVDLCVGMFGHAGAWLARGLGRVAPCGIGARRRGVRETQVHPCLERSGDLVRDRLEHLLQVERRVDHLGRAREEREVTGGVVHGFPVSPASSARPLRGSALPA